MSVKLNLGMRYKITEQLVHRAYLDRATKNMAEQVAISADMYDLVYPRETRAKMEALPEGWLPKVDHLQVQYGTGNTYCYFAQQRIRVARDGWHVNYGSEENPAPTVHRVVLARHRTGTVLALEATHPMAERLTAHKSEQADIGAGIIDLASATMRTMNQFSTVASLVKAWPEIEPFVSKYLAAPERVYLPAPLLRDLNKRLDLPVKEKEAA